MIFFLKELDRIKLENGLIYSVADTSTADALSFCINFKNNENQKHYLNIFKLKPEKTVAEYILKEKTNEIIYELSEKVWFGYSINPSQIYVYSDIDKHITRLSSFDLTENLLIRCLSYSKILGCLFVGGKGFISLYKYFNSAIYFVKTIIIENDESIQKIEVLKSNLIVFLTEKKLQIRSFVAADNDSLLPTVPSDLKIINRNIQTSVKKSISIKEALIQEVLVMSLNNSPDTEFTS